MADITEQHEQPSPTELDEAHGNGNAAAGENRGLKRQRTAADDDDDDDEKGGRERRKIEIKFISDKSRRHITFSKRKAGIMKKVRMISAHSATRPRCWPSQRDSRGNQRVLLGRLFNTSLTLATYRPMNCPSSRARKCCCWSFRKPVSFTHSPRQNSSHWLPRPKERISFRYARALISPAHRRLRTSM